MTNSLYDYLVMTGEEQRKISGQPEAQYWLNRWNIMTFIKSRTSILDKKQWNLFLVVNKWGHRKKSKLGPWDERMGTNRYLWQHFPYISLYHVNNNPWAGPSDDHHFTSESGQETSSWLVSGKTMIRIQAILIQYPTSDHYIIWASSLLTSNFLLDLSGDSSLLFSSYFPSFPFVRLPW